MSPSLIALGILLTIASVRDTQGDLYKLWGEEFLGDGQRPGFGAAAVAVGAAASLGYIGPLRPASNVLTLLIMFGMIVSNMKTGVNFYSRVSDFLTKTTQTTEFVQDTTEESTSSSILDRMINDDWTIYN